MDNPKGRSHNSTDSLSERELMRTIVRALTFAAAFAGLLIGMGCAGSDRDSRRTEPSLEYKLAVVHRSGYVPEDDPLIAQFGRVLDYLEAKCPENRQQLADMGVKGRQMLSEKHIDEALLDVFERWRASIPDEAEKGQLGPCADILGIYIAMRVGQ